MGRAGGAGWLHCGKHDAGAVEAKAKGDLEILLTGRIVPITLASSIASKTEVLKNTRRPTDGDHEI
jgi:hypothetical protein